MHIFIVIFALFRKISVDDLVKMLDSEEDMIAADYRIPMSIGESAHAEVSIIGLWFKILSNQWVILSAIVYITLL